MKKSEALAQLALNPELGVTVRHGVELMTYREFLDWYCDAGHERLTIEEQYNEEKDCDEYVLVTRSAADSRKVYHRETFSTYEEANAAYYAAMELKYNNDNGAGGIWLPASEIDQLDSEYWEE
jgi:hypothetical protein